MARCGVDWGWAGVHDRCIADRCIDRLRSGIFYTIAFVVVELRTFEVSVPRIVTVFALFVANP